MVETECFAKKVININNEEYAVDVVKSDGDITRFYFDERGMAKTFSEIVEHAIGLSTTLLKRNNSGSYKIMR